MLAEERLAHAAAGGLLAAALVTAVPVVGAAEVVLWGRGLERSTRVTSALAWAGVALGLAWTVPVGMLALASALPGGLASNEGGRAFAVAFGVAVAVAVVGAVLVARREDGGGE